MIAHSFDDRRRANRGVLRHLDDSRKLVSLRKGVTKFHFPLVVLCSLFTGCQAASVQIDTQR